tara:strand:+ start:242 stop:631 length:390 start_codon:yes stop_codon:yes gene_type:complete
MATVTLTFNNSINASLQAKATDVASNTSNTDNGAWDNIYFVKISNGKQFGDVKYLGYCTAVNRTNNTVSVEVATNTPTPSDNDFIFFAKSNIVNTSALSGYYAEIEMKNDSTSYAELFAVSSQISISSK